MNYYDSSSSSQSFDWLVFVVILLAVGVTIAGLIVWLVVFRGKTAKKKQRLRKHRRLNPTLAQTGGLPPIRDPNQPPSGV